MRLRGTDQDKILQAIASVIGTEEYQVFLYGSRISDTARGGDVDLLLLCSSEIIPNMRQRKPKVLAAIEKSLGERKVDLTIASNDPSVQTDFVKSILEKAVELS